MRIALTNVFVDDQAKALRFYTEILGFQKKQDFPVGDARWLTVVADEDPDGVELLLEPMGLREAVDYQRAVYEAGLPAKVLHVQDVQAEYDRLVARGVDFRMTPTTVGAVTFAQFDDTCGNLIQLVQA